MNTELIEAVKQAQNGDAAAFDEIYRLTNKSVYYTALKIVGNSVDAEDIAQDTYINVFKKLPELKDARAFPKWLNVIAVNLSKNHLIKKRPELFESDEQEEQLINAASLESETPKPEQILDKKETDRMIYELIDELPPEQREAVVLYYYNEFSVDSIAEMTNVSKNTVKSRLSYARKHIKKELESLAKTGTKLYGIPAVGALLAALEKGAAAPDTLSAAPAENGSAGEGIGTGTATANSGIGAKIAAGVAGAAFVGIGIAVGTHFLGGTLPETEDPHFDDSVFSEQIYIDEEMPYEYDKILTAADSQALYETDEGFQLIDLNSGYTATEDETDKFDDIIYPFNNQRNTCLLRDDGVFCTYTGGWGTFYENCIDVSSPQIMLCEATGEPFHTSPRRYRLMSEENGEELFVFDESVCIGDDTPRYQPFNDTEYAYIGTEGDSDKFSGNYLIAVDYYGNCTVIYGDISALGVDEYTDSEKSVMEEAYPDYSVLSASAFNRYILMDITDFENTKQVLYDLINESFIESDINYTSIVYVESADGNDVLVLNNENAENGYTICDNKLNILLDGLHSAQYSNNPYYLLISKDGKEGYYNCRTGAVSNYDQASLFGNYGALVWVDENQYFINKQLEICSEALPLSFYEMLPNTDFVFVRESNKLYRFMSSLYDSDAVN